MIDGQGDREARVAGPFSEPVEEDPTEAVEEAEPYFPPTDPVVRPGPDVEVNNGFSPTSMDGDASAPPRAETGGSADEALAARIRRELREDAATADLGVHVRVKNGVATLTGKVLSIEDTDNAMEVAARVPGVVDVVDKLEIAETV
jgi:hypothetical protein